MKREIKSMRDYWKRNGPLSSDYRKRWGYVDASSAGIRVINRLLEDSCNFYSIWGASWHCGESPLSQTYCRTPLPVYQIFGGFLVLKPLLSFSRDSGYGAGVKVERSKRGNDTRRSRGPEKGPQGVDPSTSREIFSEWAPCSCDTRDIPSCLLCHGHSLRGRHY